MNLSAVFIRRPVATILVTIAIAAAGALAFGRLPVAPLPAVDFPTIRVQAQMSGASPETMAATVAAPLERHLGQIADVTEMTSQSSVGSTDVILQFGLDRDINGAARDVQAAINAARADLPSALKSNPTYRKFNPADAPILIVSLTSKTLTPGQLYDSAATVLQQRLMQIDGIGNVDLNGSSLPAVRVELNAGALFKYGIGLEDVRAALSAANADSAKGMVSDGALRWQLYANDQAERADEYRNLVVAWRNSRPVFLRDVAEVNDSVESLRNAGYVNGKPAVMLWIFKQPGGNIVDVIDRVKAVLPQLQAALPPGTEVTVSDDRSSTIRASLSHTERTLVIAVVLVVLVV
ncbi:MAG: efflux RND transporter permease subunit, partial [Paraburkholderia tropica]